MRPHRSGKLPRAGRPRGDRAIRRDHGSRRDGRPGSAPLEKGRRRIPPGFVLAALLCAPAGGTGETLTILTYNVWHGFYRDERARVFRLPEESADHREERLRDQERLLRRLAPDLVFLQEVNDLPRRAARYARALGGYASIHQLQDCGIKLLGAGVPTNVFSGLAVLARPGLSLERLAAVKLSGPALSACHDRFGFQTGELRYALLGALTLADGRRVLVVNTHLHASARRTEALERGLAELVRDAEIEPAQAADVEARLDAAARRRLAETRRLLAAIGEERRRSSYAAVVLAGDLNATPSTPVLEAVEAAGFRNATRAARGDDLATWDPDANPLIAPLAERWRANLPWFGNPRLRALIKSHDPAPRQIDHVFLAGLAPDAATHAALFATSADGGEPPAAPGDPGTALPRFPSDHFGLVIRLEIE